MSWLCPHPLKGLKYSRIHAFFFKNAKSFVEVTPFPRPPTENPGPTFAWKTGKLKGSTKIMKPVGISRKYLFENIRGLQYYELTSRCSPLPLLLTLPLTCVVYPWSVLCKCALIQNPLSDGFLPKGSLRR